MKSWIIPIKLVCFNFNGNGKKNITGNAVVAVVECRTSVYQYHVVVVVLDIT